MKIIHLSDLHIGKRVNEFSMLEDQKYILSQITDIIDDEKPDCVVIAGDIYDKPIPPAEAVELFDDFIVSLAERKLKVFIISGNHDSPERLAFGNRLMSGEGTYISPVYSGDTKYFTINDDCGEVRIYMLPFVKPSHVRKHFPEKEINSYTDAVRIAIEQMNIDENVRNVLVTHQFVTGASRSESEEISVGGSDNVDASVFDGFDYVALGHIHGPQNIGSERVRYSGTPLKYSFSEASHKKSVTVAELFEKGRLTVRTVPLVPKRDMAEIKGTYAELTLKSFYENATYREDYMHITLTDEDDIPDAAAKLRVIYPNLMKMDYDNRRTRHKAEIDGTREVKKKSPFELFGEFYALQNGSEMSAEQAEFIGKIIEEIEEGER